MVRKTFVFFLILIFINLNGVNAIAEIKESEFEKHQSAFISDVEMLMEYQNSSFWDRHKGKMIGGVAGVVVAGGIIFITWGSGTPAAAGAGSSTALYCATATSGIGAATLTGGILSAGTIGGVLLDRCKENDIKITPEMKKAIEKEIVANQDDIMAEAKSADEAMKIMLDIAIRAVENYE